MTLDKVDLSLLAPLFFLFLERSFYSFGYLKKQQKQNNDKKKQNKQTKKPRLWVKEWLENTICVFFVFESYTASSTVPCTK